MRMQVGSSKASTHGDEPLPPAGKRSDLSSAPAAAAPPHRVIQTHTGASPGLWVGVCATPSSCRESMATTPGTGGTACPPMLGRQRGHWGRGTGAVWQKAGNGCQNKILKRGRKI